MKMFFDFFPIFIFFLVFKFLGIYWATGIFLIASVFQMISYWLYFRKFDFIHILTFFLGMIFGGATLLFHDVIFIKLKPTIAYWCLAAAFGGSEIIGEKNLIRRLMDSKIQLENKVWFRINLQWILFFLLMGLANLFVIYNFDTDTWVNFKLFGLLGLTFAFVILQSFYLNKHTNGSCYEKN